MHNTYKDGEVLRDHVEVQAEGTYDNIATDPVAREKMNKYGLDFGEQQPPDDHVRMTVQQPDGTHVTGKAPVSDPTNWELEDKPTEK